MEAIRLCVGCNVRAPRQELQRVVHRNGQVIPDIRGSLSGRGAHVHLAPTCIEQAVRRGAFSRALRVSGQLDASPLENRLENTMDN